MKHIMSCALSSLLQLVQYTVHRLRYFNNIYPDTPELHTTELPTNCTVQHTPYVTPLIN
jgi:hypothetical protein